MLYVVAVKNREGFENFEGVNIRIEYFYNRQSDVKIFAFSMWFKHDLDAAVTRSEAAVYQAATESGTGPATRSEAAVYQAATESGTGPATVGKSADDKVILIYMCIILGSVCLIMGVALAMTCVVACARGRNTFKPEQTGNSTNATTLVCNEETISTQPTVLGNTTTNKNQVETSLKADEKPAAQSTPITPQTVLPLTRSDAEDCKYNLSGKFASEDSGKMEITPIL